MPWTEPATQACAMTRYQTDDLSLHGMMPHSLSPTSQGMSHGSFYHRDRKLSFKDNKTFRDTGLALRNYGFLHFSKETLAFLDFNFP